MLAVALSCGGVAQPVSADTVVLRVIAYLGTPCLPAAHAHVMVDHARMSVVTDSLGVAILRDLPAGEHRLFIDHPVTSARTITVRIERGVRVTRLIDLLAEDSAASPYEDHSVDGEHPRSTEKL
jgi:hypothetical protein